MKCLIKHQFKCIRHHPRYACNNFAHEANDTINSSLDPSITVVICIACYRVPTPMNHHDSTSIMDDRRVGRNGAGVVGVIACARCSQERTATGAGAGQSSTPLRATSLSSSIMAS